MSERNIKSLLPGVIRKPLGSVRRRLAASAHYLKGKRILRDYTAYYRRSQRIFRRDGHTAQTLVSSLSDLGIQVILPGAKKSLITLPENYSDLVERVARSAGVHLSDSKNCSFFPKLGKGPLPEQTTEVPAVRNGEVMLISLANPLQVDGLEDLCAPLMTELERNVYGSYAMLDKVYVFRSTVCHLNPRASRLWHYDNHPREIIKLMIYLTDVDAGTGPFEYLRETGTLRAVCGSPLAPLFGNSRVSTEAIKLHLANGLEKHMVIGPTGTMILFDNNMIHRGNLAQDGARDALVLQMRPATFKTRPYIDPRWTGSFQHQDFSVDPSNFSPVLGSLTYHT